MIMKKKIWLIIVLSILILVSCLKAWPAGSDITQNQTIPTVYQTDPEKEEIWSDTTPVTETRAPTVPVSEPQEETKPAESKPSAGNNPTEKPAEPKPTMPKPTTPKPTEPPKATAPAETKPAQTLPPETEATAPTEIIEELAPPITAPPETEPVETVPETTEPAAPEITYEFKRQVASYAAQYINQYRGSACTVLPGMSQVAQYRAGQLTWNYGHSTADKRAALAHFQYGRYVDATEFGDDPSNSYWEADSAEAICAGFYGTDPKTMGKKIADMIRNSSGHWSYISSSEYSYIGVGVEYREGSEYGWYCCVMVGSVNYG